jgi:hypothetical protein
MSNLPKTSNSSALTCNRLPSGRIAKRRSARKTAALAVLGIGLTQSSATGIQQALPFVVCWLCLFEKHNMKIKIITQLELFQISKIRTFAWNYA